MNSNGTIDRLDRVFIVVTNSCNARCLLCDYWKNKPKKFLPLAFIQKEVVPLISRYNVGLTLISGGEPTLHPHLPEITKALKKTGTSITLITNAARLKRVFAEINDHVDGYMFSLDASHAALYREIRGLDNFNEIIDWPARILDHNPTAQIAFSCLIQEKNVKDLVDLYLLAADLPIDALFFNVPELKPNCFGRGDSLPPETYENAILSDREMVVLEENLKKILQLDAGRGKLFQGESFFDNCVRYFRSLRSGKKAELNSKDRVCRVPFTSIVIDESQQIYPCFYLPYSEALKGVGEPLDSDYLKNFRKDMFNNPDLRKKYCSFCLQFQG